MANTDYGSMNVSALKVELRKRGAKLNGLKEQLIQRLQDYDRNNNFVGNITDGIKNDDLAYTVEWPSDSSYISVTSKSVSPYLDIVNISTYFLEVYRDNVGMTECAAVHRKGYNMMINEYLVALVTCTQNNLHFYRGQVHSENTKALSYFMSIAFESDGKIVQSMCECAAGMGSKAVCKHIACVCYAILRFKEHSEWRIKKKPTENKQIWHEPIRKILHLRYKNIMSPDQKEIIYVLIHVLIILAALYNDPTEIRAYHLVASSRLGDSSVLLLDSRGCPTGQVDFPAFTRLWLGGTQRLTARFKAFRFPTSHIVRFALMVRFCDHKCPPVECNPKQNRSTRQTNATLYQWGEEVPAAVRADTPRASGVVAQGGAAPCAPSGDDAMALELDLLVDSKDILSVDTLVRADHRSTMPEESKLADGSMVCVHELLLVSLALAWLAVQILLLLGCCVLVKRYRNLAELNMQKDYQSFDNVGFDTVSTHRRVHWPDQNIDILHAT